MNQPAKNKTFKGFTLVELLVVISIIALMMAILMPSLAKIRQQAYRSHCLWNLSQLSLAWQMYATDNNGFLCSPYTSKDEAPLKNNWVADGNNLNKQIRPPRKFRFPGQRRRRSSYPISPKTRIEAPAVDPNTIDTIGGTAQAIKGGVLWPYLKEMEVYQCHAEWSKLLRSYAIAYTMGGAGNENDSRDGILPFGEYGEIDKPSQRIVFADASTKHHFLYGPFWPVELRDGQLKFKPYTGFNGQYMTARHSNGANFSFADMHCEYVRYKSKKTIKMINEKISSEEASQNNPDLNKMTAFLRGREE